MPNRDSAETKRWGMTTKAIVAIATLLVGAAGAGVGGGAYTAKHTSLTEDRVAAVVTESVGREIEKLRADQADQMRTLRSTVADLQSRMSREEATIAMIQSEMLPRLKSLEDQTAKTFASVEYLRGLLERKTQ